MVSRQEETRRISNEEDGDDKEARSFVMQLASAAAFPMTVRAALELELPEIIARAGPGAQLSPTEIAAQIPTQNPQAPVTLDRILRLLASYNVLTCSLVDDEGGKVGRRYGLGPVCKYLTRNEDGVSMAPLVLMNHDNVFMKTWYYMKEAVMEGAVPFDKAYGMTAFEYPGTDPRFNRVFNAAMSGHSSVTMKKMLEIYGGFEGINILVDVGGGVGTNLNMIVSKHPTIRGINFDLPHVIADAPPHPGLEHVGGDMFESVPCGDAIFMKWILHDWSDQHCVKVLKNCWKALPETGKVIVVEGILPVAPETTKEAQGQFHMDLLMLAYNPGGKERTEAEFESLAMEAGFSQLRKVFTAFNAWIMEFTK